MTTGFIKCGGYGWPLKSSLSGMWAPKLIGMGSQGIREASERWGVSKALSWSWEAKGGEGLGQSLEKDGGSRTSSFKKNNGMFCLLMEMNQ